MAFNNNSKFELLRYGNNSHLKQRTKYFAPDGSEIEGKAYVKDLGVLMSNSGSFSEHINKNCKKQGICVLGFFGRLSQEPLLLWSLCGRLGPQLVCPAQCGQIRSLRRLKRILHEKLNYLKS